jgi:drug/metabolite transporter (DMT)-like permease
VVAIWSGFIVISRAGMVGAVPPLDLAALRIFVAAAICLPFFVRDGWTGVGPWRVLVLAATAGVGFALFAFHGFERAPANHGAVLLPGVLPLWVALLGWLAIGERPGRLRLIGLGLIAAGVGVLIADSLGDTWRQAVGDALFLCGSFTWAVFTLLARHWRVPPLQAATLVAVGAGALYAPPYLALTDWGVLRLSWTVLIGQGLYQGVLGTLVSVLLFTKAVASLGPQRTAMITAIVPTVATVLAIPVIGDVPTLVAAGGLALVTIGMISAVLPDRPAAATEKTLSPGARGQ